jgi:hypothetical protein
MLNEIKGFLLLFKIFIRFFVNQSLKVFWLTQTDFWPMGFLAGFWGVFAGFLAWGFWGFLAGFWQIINLSISCINN